MAKKNNFVKKEEIQENEVTTSSVESVNSVNEDTIETPVEPNNEVVTSQTLKNESNPKPIKSANNEDLIGRYVRIRPNVNKTYTGHEFSSDYKDMTWWIDKISVDEVTIKTRVRFHNYISCRFKLEDLEIL